MNRWNKFVIFGLVEPRKDGWARSIALRMRERNLPKSKRMRTTFWPMFSNSINAKKTHAKIFRYPPAFVSASYLLRRKMKHNIVDQMSALHLRPSRNGRGSLRGKNGPIGEFVLSVLTYGRYVGHIED